MLDTSRFPSLRAGDVFLNPGEMHCGFAPARVWTILGSCVSIIVWHEKLQFGGMTHYLLPERTEHGSTASLMLDPRYGVDACKLMLAAMHRAGVRPEQCQSRIFGGSRMNANGRSGTSIGQRNATIAHDFLAANRIRVVSESLFGAGHRRVYFDLASGRVWESEATCNLAGTVRRSGKFS